MNATSLKSNSKNFILHVCVALFVILGGLYLLHMRLVATSCSSDVRRISSPDRKEYATIEDTVCDNLGGSDVVTLSVRVGKRDMPIFVFDPSSFSTPLDVRWVDATTLDVTVARVQLIEKQIYNLNGISIRYHIGAIGEPVERLRPKQAPEGV